jgi:cytidyltransferase-like protein
MNTIVYTGGTFDILHAGHIRFFQHIKHLFPDCDLIIGLNTDEFIESYKGRKPTFSYKERWNQLEMMGLADSIIENIGNKDSKPAILEAFEGVSNTTKFHDGKRVIAIGQDWLGRDYCGQMGFTPQWLTDNNISLVYVPHTDGISSTEIRERLSK